MHAIGWQSRFATAVVVATLALAAQPGRAAEEVVSFKLDVMPLLESRCVACHGPGGEGFTASGLDLTSHEGLMKGTRHGPIVIPGEPLTSNLNVLIEGRAAPELRMPHNQRPLLRYQTLIIRDWVKQGAKDN